MSGSLLRTFFKSVMCLAKIGAEVLIEASAGHGLTLKAMNSARSAFCSVTFKQASFDVFHVRAGTLQTAVLANISPLRCARRRSSESSSRSRLGMRQNSPWSFSATVWASPRRTACTA